ncbi:uncharacterized protein BJX67DRAFT_365870 [Aspergillus lucknowensis]|uniref:Uncharacterized protein n=1 Tax=Aspergillus lucknowensis TaxID=176173 RepID=A0ABR4LDJ9_9EURO
MRAFALRSRQGARRPANPGNRATPESPRRTRRASASRSLNSTQRHCATDQWLYDSFFKRGPRPRPTHQAPKVVVSGGRAVPPALEISPAIQASDLKYHPTPPNVILGLECSKGSKQGTAVLSPTSKTRSPPLEPVNPICSENEEPVTHHGNQVTPGKHDSPTRCVIEAAHKMVECAALLEKDKWRRTAREVAQEAETTALRQRIEQLEKSLKENEIQHKKELEDLRSSTNRDIVALNEMVEEAQRDIRKLQRALNSSRIGRLDGH